MQDDLANASGEAKSHVIGDPVTVFVAQCLCEQLHRFAHNGILRLLRKAV